MFGRRKAEAPPAEQGVETSPDKDVRGSPAGEGPRTRGVVAQKSVDASDEAKIEESLNQANKPRRACESRDNCGSRTGLGAEGVVQSQRALLGGAGGGEEQGAGSGNGGPEGNASFLRTHGKPLDQSLLLPGTWPCPRPSPVPTFTDSWGLVGLGCWGPVPAEKMDRKEAKGRP